MAVSIIKTLSINTRTIQETTSSSGAIQIPTDIASHFISAYTPDEIALVYKRDSSWITVKDGATLQPIANKSIKVIITYWLGG